MLAAEGSYRVVRAKFDWTVITIEVIVLVAVVALVVAAVVRARPGRGPGHHS